jgi:hypothetical protein
MITLNQKNNENKMGERPQAVVSPKSHSPTIGKKSMWLCCFPDRLLLTKFDH